MVFAGLVLLSVYLPTRASLQKATQFAATAIATGNSDTWLSFDPETMEYQWAGSRDELPNVYKSVFRAFGNDSIDGAGNVETIVTKVEQQGIVVPAGELTVEYTVLNYVIYKEIRVTATRVIKSPVNLDFARFPREIPITVTSSAVVVNGDEFVRNMDVARDLTNFLAEKFKLNETFDHIKTLTSKFNDFLGI